MVRNREKARLCGKVLPFLQTKGSKMSVGVIQYDGMQRRDQQKKAEDFMKFRPCIDIHNGAVKQIVGGSLQDAGNAAVENYISRQDADYYATMYKKDGLTGGHIILLNPPASEYYDATKAQALKALHAYPGGMHPVANDTPVRARLHLFQVFSNNPIC